MRSDVLINCVQEFDRKQCYNTGWKQTYILSIVFSETQKYI